MSLTTISSVVWGFDDSVFGSVTAGGAGAGPGGRVRIDISVDSGAFVDEFAGVGLSSFADSRSNNAATPAIRQKIAVNPIVRAGRDMWGWYSKTAQP